MKEPKTVLEEISDIIRNENKDHSLDMFIGLAAGAFCTLVVVAALISIFF